MQCQRQAAPCQAHIEGNNIVGLTCRSKTRQLGLPGPSALATANRWAICRCSSTQYAASTSGRLASHQHIHVPDQGTSAAEATVSASTYNSAMAAAAPYGTITRILLTGQNSYMFRTALSQRRPPVAGPLGLLLFLFTLVAACLAAVRAALVRKVKACKTCRGFGIQRCRLCLGAGRVDWAAKLNHFDVCPLCMDKRFVVCNECGGYYHRPLFCHVRRRAGGKVQELGDVYAAAEQQMQQPRMASAMAGGMGGWATELQSTMMD
eukprot:jgi/Chrzof1/5339/Cz15g23030.t1